MTESSTVTQQEYTIEQAMTEPRRLGIRVRLATELESLPDSDIAALKQLLAIHGVVNLIEQTVKPAELQSFVARWGDVIELTGGLAFDGQEPGLPSICRVGNVRPDGTIIPDVHFAEYWHHDGDFSQAGQNWVINFLSSVVVPSVGGATGFIDMRKAYDSLDTSQRDKLHTATICVRASEISDFQDASPEEIPRDAEHPVVALHPISRQPALYMPDSSTGIQDANGSPLGSVEDWMDPLIDEVGIVEHKWAVGDLLIFDNYQTMHRGMGGYGDSPRLLYRCQARLTV